MLNFNQTQAVSELRKFAKSKNLVLRKANCFIGDLHQLFFSDNAPIRKGFFHKPLKKPISCVTVKILMPHRPKIIHPVSLFKKDSATQLHKISRRFCLKVKFFHA